MGTLIDGKKIAEKINAHSKERVELLKAKGITPKLAVILVGDDPASHTYVRKKGEAAEKLGIDFVLKKLPATISETELVNEIKTVQSDSALSGLIVQLPLPEDLYNPTVLNTIRPDIDVDCLTHENLGRLVMRSHYIEPPTPGAVLAILEDLKVSLAGKNVAIIGMGALVGKPTAIMMVNEGASVTTINSRTTDVKAKCLAADIIISGVGKKGLVTGDMIKPGAIVIDTGFDYVDGKVYGDVVVDEALEKASHVTPTPGGVGPITVARLLWNTVVCAERNVKD